MSLRASVVCNVVSGQVLYYTCVRVGKYPNKHVRSINVTTSESSPPTAYDVVVKNRQRWQRAIPAAARAPQRTPSPTSFSSGRRFRHLPAIVCLVSRGSTPSLTCHDDDARKHRRRVYHNMGTRKMRKKFRKKLTTPHTRIIYLPGRFCSLLNATAAAAAVLL